MNIKNDYKTRILKPLIFVFPYYHTIDDRSIIEVNYQMSDIDIFHSMFIPNWTVSSTSKNT